MLDCSAAHSRRHNLDGPVAHSKRHSWSIVGGCMASLAQMFHSNQVLRGSNETPADFRIQVMGKVTKSKIKSPVPVLQLVTGQRQTTSSASMSRPGPVDLRQILDAKQEPFVLHEVIHEKRQPIRSNSSRELMMEINEKVTTARRLKESKHAARSSNCQLRVHVHQGDSSIQYTPSFESFVVKKRTPAETMITLPTSSQAFSRAGTKMACPHPAKKTSSDHNKRALLIEAAAKILEGSSRQLPRVPSRSVQCLLEELEESSPKQVLFEDCHKRYSKGLLRHTGNCKVFAKNGVINETQASTYSLTTVDCSVMKETRASTPSITPMKILFVPQDMSNVERRSKLSPCLGVEECDKESYSEPFNKTLRDDLEKPSNLSNVPLNLEETVLVTPKLTVADSLVREIDDIEPATPTDLGKARCRTDLSKYRPLNDRPLNEGHLAIHAAFSDPPAQVARFSEEDHCIPLATIGRSHEEPFQGPPQETLQTRVSGDAVVEQKFCDLVLGSVGHFKSNARDEHAEDVNKTLAVVETRTPIFLLCNYSWWRHEKMQGHPPLRSTGICKEQFPGMHAESPAMDDGKSPCIAGRMDENNIQEECSSEKLQHSSPVSVLDVLSEEEDSMDGSTFDYFEEARQKLLDTVTRFEMLAGMDVDTLVKVSKQEDCHSDCEDESSLIDIGCREASPAESFAHHIDHGETKIDNLPSACVVGEAKAIGLNLCSAQPITGKFEADKESPRRCKLSVGSLDDSSELDVLRLARHVPRYSQRYGLVYLDMGTWGCFTEEVEELEMELESNIMGVLMQELLFDLIHAN